MAWNGSEPGPDGERTGVPDRSPDGRVPRGPAPGRGPAAPRATPLPGEALAPMRALAAAPYAPPIVRPPSTTSTVPVM